MNLFRSRLCPFCNVRAATLLCDGKKMGDVLCDSPICRACAGPPAALVHVKLRRGCQTQSRDLCPPCRKAGVEAGWAKPGS